MLRPLAAASFGALLLSSCATLGIGQSATTTTTTTTTTTLPPVLAPVPLEFPALEYRMQQVKKIGGNITPKSVVASKTGYVIGQNMMYTHGVSIYDAEGEPVKRVTDTVSRQLLGLEGEGKVKGSPVEADFSADGAFAYVSNYAMYGAGFNREGNDECEAGDGFDDSYLYKIDMATRKVVAAALVGSVPKYVQASDDGKWVLVTNWCGFSLSIVDAVTMQTVKTIPLGKHPRGIAITSDSTRAYVSVMGAAQIATIDLTTLELLGKTKVSGIAPRHIVLSPDEKFLYVTFNLSNTVSKLSVPGLTLVKNVRTAERPRTLDISPDGTVVYLVNYAANQINVLNTENLKTVQTIDTCYRPIGITYEPVKNRVWVACYSGQILIFDLVRGP